MPSTKVLCTLALITVAYALPTPQLAGEGAAANSIFSDTDNGIGHGIENVEENTAALVSSTKGGAAVPATRRQLAGEGAAADSLFSDTDNGVGHGIENIEDNTASLISSLKGGSTTGTTGGSSAPPPPPPPARRTRRQLDKVSNGAQTLSEALGTGSSTSAVTTALDNIDGESTSGAANAGAQIGGTEDSTLENTGKAIPKRQLDKIAKGMQTLSNAAGTGAATTNPTNGLINIDGTLTQGASNIGADVGGTEDGVLEEAGDSVPTSLKV